MICRRVVIKGAAKSCRMCADGGRLLVFTPWAYSHLLIWVEYMRIVKIISIILAVLLAAGLAVLLTIDGIREQERLQRADELETSLRPLRVELNRLQNELDLLEQEYNKNIHGTGTVTLLYNGADAAIYDAVCSGMEEYGYSGTIAISPDAFPGDDGCISVARFRDLISGGWSWCVRFPEDSDSPEEDVASLLERADALGIKRSTVIIFPEGCYSAERDKWAASLGFDIMIHHGEDDKLLLVGESGEGIWYPGCVDWRSNLRRVYLASAADQSSHFVFEINFRDELFDTDDAYHVTLLRAMKEYTSNGHIQIMNPKEARNYRREVENGFDRETAAYKEKREIINQQIRLIEEKVDKFYSDFSMEQDGK